MADKTDTLINYTFSIHFLRLGPLELAQSCAELAIPCERCYTLVLILLKWQFLVEVVMLL